MAKDDDFKLKKPGEIRTRFAPSPTGSFHIGNARTALFNFLFSRNQQGRVILRIEDTDEERSTPENEKNLIEILKWLGIDWDEGPDIGGDYGPYRQSERLEIYQKYLKKLLEQGSAYYCFCLENDLEAQRQYLMSLGKPPIYNGKCHNLPEKTIKKYLEEGRPSIIRFKTSSKKIVFEDLVKDRVEIDADVIGDFSIARNLKSPLYNFACAIDDFEMKISHVIRGDDHLSNTPKQILIYEALGLSIPKFGHLPMVLAPDKSKLSKRKHGNVTVEDFKEQGYLPEALVNFLAFLGWNPGTEREIYSMASLIKEFSLERVKKSGAIFNIKRLDYLNGFYIRQKALEDLAQKCLPYFIEAGLIEPIFESKEKVPDLTGIFGKKIVLNYAIKETKEKINFDYLAGVVSLYQERLKNLSEIVELTDYFFKEKLDYQKDLLKWKNQTNNDVLSVLDKLEKILSKIKDGDWNKQNLENILLTSAAEWGRAHFQTEDRGYVLWPFRMALTGKKASAEPFDIAEILGKQKTLKRIKQAKELTIK